MTFPWGDRPDEPVIVNGHPTRQSTRGETIGAVVMLAVLVFVFTWMTRLIFNVVFAVADRLLTGEWGHHFGWLWSPWWLAYLAVLLLLCAAFRRQLRLDRTEVRGK